MHVRQSVDALGCQKRGRERLPGDEEGEKLLGRVSRNACREQRAYRNSCGPLLVVSLLREAGWGKELNGAPAQRESLRTSALHCAFIAADCLELYMIRAHELPELIWLLAQKMHPATISLLSPGFRHASGDP